MFIVKGVLTNDIVYKEFKNVGFGDFAAHLYFNKFVDKIQRGKIKGDLEIIDTTTNKIIDAYPHKRID